MSTWVESRTPLVAIAAVSAAACAFLFWLLYARDVASAPDQFAFLPAMNATLNAASATCLVLGFGAIRRGDIPRHRAFMMSAFAFSSLFLVGYIMHHALHGDTRFGGEGTVKIVYLGILASHVVLSIAALPMVLTTFFFSLSNQLQRHRRLARYTLPVWLYVSLTGVVVFLLLEAFGKA